jgi:hypothetical protein
VKGKSMSGISKIEEQLAAAKAQKAKIEQRIARLKSEQSKRERNARTKRLIEIGAVVEKFANQEIKRDDLALLEEFLAQHQTSLQNMLRM